MKKIIIPAVLTSYRPLSDKSFNLTFNTLVPNPEQKVVIDSLHQELGYLMFKDGDLSKIENEQFDSLQADLNDTNKTQSQRMRNVLYRYWEKDNKGHKEFKDFYKEETEKIITHYKSKLD